MPSGIRYRIKLNETLYDLSTGQFEMLSKKSFRLRKLDEFDWKYQQRINGLVSKSLFRKKNGSYERTKLGSEVLQALKGRAKTTNY